MSNKGNYGSIVQNDLGRSFEIYLDRDLTEPEDFRAELQAIRSCGPADKVTIYMNCHGGRLDTMMSFVNSIRNTRAEVMCVAEGTIASAATMIAMVCDSVVIMPHTRFMIHNVSYGACGFGNNVQAQAEFYTKENQRLLEDLYQGFLSVEEIAKVVGGQELWLSDDEALERFKKRATLLAEKQEEDSQD